MASRHDGARPSPMRSSCSAPRSTTAGRRRCWPRGSTTRSSCTGGRSRSADRRHRGQASRATASPRRPSSPNYLLERACPTRRSCARCRGTTSWESLAAAARFLRERGLDEVLLVSDPYHALRIGGIADELGLTRTSRRPARAPSAGLRRSGTWSRRPARVGTSAASSARRLTVLGQLVVGVTRGGRAATADRVDAHSGVV